MWIESESQMQHVVTLGPHLGGALPSSRGEFLQSLILIEEEMFPIAQKRQPEEYVFVQIHVMHNQEVDITHYRVGTTTDLGNRFFTSNTII